MVIQRADRLAEVISRDERLVETFVAASPVFKGLRNSIMRKTMGRLTTVEQAAQVAGIDPDMLTDRLNRALSGGPEPTDSRPTEPEPTDPTTASQRNDTPSPDRNEMPSIPSEAPSALASIAPEQVLEVDVREDLRNGHEPFTRIMEARREVPPGGVLCLRAIFEPFPLYAVLAKQGFAHWTEELAPDDWRVWFYPDEAGDGQQDENHHPSSSAPPPVAPDATDSGDDVIILDVRGMEPPEPMVHTLAALEELPQGKTLLQINERVPQFLLPRLEELGFRYDIRKQNDALVRVFIRRRDE